MKGFWKNILILTAVVTLIPIGFNLLYNAFFQASTDEEIPFGHVVAFTVSITFILTLSNTMIVQYVRNNNRLFENRFAVRITFLLSSVTLSAAVIMFCFTWLWRYFATSQVEVVPADYFANILLAVVISIVVTGIMEYKNSFELWKESITRESKLREQNTRTELEMLKNQVEPHFLFNTLNGIYVESGKKPEKTRESILRFSKLLSYRLYQSQKEFIPLDEEVEYLRDYIEIEKSRQGNSVFVTTSFEAEHNVSIPPGLFGPVIENAFKYGLKSGMDEYYIRTSVQVKDDRVVFSCENNYKPVPKEDENGGLGLSNLRERLQLIYGSDHELNIEDTKSKFRVTMKIPVK